MDWMARVCVLQGYFSHVSVSSGKDLIRILGCEEYEGGEIVLIQTYASSGISREDAIFLLQ